MIPRHVLLTGASTGIGRHIALDLARRGFVVHAVVRQTADAETLMAEAGPGALLRPLLADLLSPGAPAALMPTLAARVGTDGLYALINNAGRNLNGPFEFHQDADARALMELNFHVPVALMTGALPLLRRHLASAPACRPRIVNVGSIGGLIGFPWEAFYHASKFALTGLSESLRQELAAHGIAVTVVMPGGIRTPFLAKTRDSITAAAASLPDTDVGKRYRHSMAVLTRTTGLADRYGRPPQDVAAAVARVLESRSPRFQVLVGADARLLLTLRQLLPIGWAHRVWAAAFGT